MERMAKTVVTVGIKGSDPSIQNLDAKQGD